MRTPIARDLRTRQGEDRDADLTVSLGFSKALDEMLLQHGEFPAPPLPESSLRTSPANSAHRYRNTSLDTLLDFRSYNRQPATRAGAATATTFTPVTSTTTTTTPTITHDHHLGYKVCRENGWYCSPEAFLSQECKY
ncbi:hypothetical protein E2C01_026563 [Portunus trituberculatus]|uniref:Uncharacterized protein n=1 Tax=Portunus trituberculatus TaxID=210409 RepID=A0A5B7EFQ9_PORTR|nr:hypothetical protein [Portunus trituberculatus]